MTAAETGRSWTIRMPAGLPLLNSNDRAGHWARRKRITAAGNEEAA